MQGRDVIAVLGTIVVAILTAVFGWLMRRRKDNADVNATITDGFDKLVNRLQRDNDDLRKEVSELRSTVVRLNGKMDELNAQLNVLQMRRNSDIREPAQVEPPARPVPPLPKFNRRKGDPDYSRVDHVTCRPFQPEENVMLKITALCLLALAGCSQTPASTAGTGTAAPGTATASTAALRAAAGLTTAERLALKYTALPVCPTGKPLCKDPTTVRKIQSLDQVAYNEVKRAEAAGPNADAAVALTAVAALTAAIPSIVSETTN